MADARGSPRTYLSIKNELNSAEARDPLTKRTYSIGPFFKMCNHHIPTNVEMDGIGLHRKRWRVAHFFGAAKYYTDNAGFPNGKLPCHEEWCHLRQDACTVYVSVFGDNIRIVDPKIKWYEQIVGFPPKLYNALNSLVTGALQKMLCCTARR